MKVSNTTRYIIRGSLDRSVALRGLSFGLAALSLTAVAINGETPLTLIAFLLLLAHVAVNEFRLAAACTETPEIARLKEASSFSNPCACVLADPPEPQFYVAHIPQTLLMVQGSGREIPVNVIDFDEIGLCGFASEEFPVPAPVRVARGTTVYFGTLRYCLPVDGAYAIRLSFQSPFDCPNLIAPPTTVECSLR